MILKIERFLSWLHLNTRWGHSGTVAMDCDGDGHDFVTIEGIDINKYKKYIEKLGNKSPVPKRVEWIGSEK